MRNLTPDEMRWLMWLLVLALVGVLMLIYALRDKFPKDRERDEPTDWQANRWLTDKHWLLYGERQ